MEGLTKTEKFYAVHCGLLFLTSIAAILVTFGLVWLARRQGDVARWCLTYSKFAAFFYILFCFVEFCADAVWVAFSRLARSVDKGDSDNIELLADLLQARVELSAASRYTDCLVVIFAFLALVIFGIGVNIVRIGEPAPQDGLIKKCSYGFAGVLAVLATVEWGIKIQVYLQSYTDPDEYDLRTEDEWTLGLLDVTRQMDFAFVVIAWALAIATLVRSTQIWLPSRRDKRLDYPLFYLMLGCGLWLLRTTYELVHQLKFINIQDIRSNPDEPAYLEMIDIVFDSWSIFAVIIIMFAAGWKKKGGLWSTPQPWMDNDESASSDGIHLGSMDASPPAYSQESSPIEAPQAAATGGSPSTGPGRGQAPQGSWQHRTSHELEDGDRALVAGLGLPQRYQPQTSADNAYNTGIVSPTSPMEAGPADVYDIGAHAEVSDGYMGMNTGPADPIPTTKPDGDDHGSASRTPSHPPPAHDEAMGLNHQADGRQPSEALPYPQKN